MLPAVPLKYFLPLVGLTVSAFVFNTSEFMPIGLLTDISQSFGMIAVRSRLCLQGRESANPRRRVRS